jgi:hypothetical protein
VTPDTPFTTNGADATPGAQAAPATSAVTPGAAGGLVLPSSTASGTPLGTPSPTAPVDVPLADADPYPDDPARPIEARTTQVMEVDTAPPAGRANAAAGRSGTPWRERLAPAGAAVRRRARELTDRYRTAPRDVRLALVGAVVTVVSFLLLPYAAGTGSAVDLGGRLWWRPLAAVAAAVLLATTLSRAHNATTANRAGTATTTNAVDRLLAAVVVATVGATEAGLVGLVSGDADGARIGYYGMLAGLVTVLVAALGAARRRCAG